MANPGEVRKNDIGTDIKITIKDGNAVVDVSSVTTKEIVFKKPSGTLVTKAASFDTDGTDGVIKYTTESGFLDEIGTWEIQGRVKFSSTQDWKTSLGNMRVHRNLE